MALTKRQWNNVLIFASLSMILLFNVTHKRWLSSDEHERLELVPADATVLTLDLPAASLELIGKGWRVTPADVISPTEAEKLVQQWLGLSATPVLPEFEQAANAALSQPDLVIRVLLAGEQNPRTILLARTNQRWFVAMGDKRGELSDLTVRFILPEYMRSPR
ncbi:hypothetical protein ACFSJ3_12310 [Corallincola platygyrae]|uniref:DUF4340 domain-containing protein n=1 Tax=Corallincola platygyrae TaxID=1193278 RepID=A0ABW4XME7_9GAMM